MELNYTYLPSARIIKLQKKLIICLFSFLLVFSLLSLTAGAVEYVMKSIPAEQVGASINGEEVIELEDTIIPYWQFLLWLAAVQIIAAVDVLRPSRLIFVLGGYRTVGSVNVLDNPSRSRVYTYIKTRPGTYISEIVEKIGLDRGTVKYHIKTLKAKRKIDSYKDGGKIRYFENHSSYNDEEKKVISALQNLTNQRIVFKIKNGNCNSNVDLAREFGISRATVSWYIKNLRETGLILETKEGRRTFYTINNSYQPLVEKYMQKAQNSYNEEWL